MREMVYPFLKLFKCPLSWLAGIFASALITATFTSFFVGDPNVVIRSSLTNQSDRQLMTARLENHNLLSVLPWLFKITDPKISVNFFTLIQKKGADGSINPCWINGKQNSTTTSIGYGTSISTEFDITPEKSGLLNTKLQNKYNVVSYARVNYSYNYKNRISPSEKHYSGVKVYMLFPESTSTLLLTDTYVDRDSPVYPTNLFAYPDSLIVAAPVPGFSLLRNAKDLECQNYIIKNRFGSQYQMTN